MIPLGRTGVRGGDQSSLHIPVASLLRNNGPMSRERVLLRDRNGDGFVLTSSASASPTERAWAIERHTAALAFGDLLRLNRHSLDLHRPALLTLSGLSSPVAFSSTRETVLHRLLLERISRGGSLILVNERRHLPNCDPEPKPTKIEEESGQESAAWTGPSKKWSQEKKLRSLHPKLRPLVEATIEGLKERGFQPFIFYAWRSLDEQRKITKKGHSKVSFSFHNVQNKGAPCAYAADIVDKRWLWTATAQKHAYWAALGEEAKKNSLHWGGDWKKPDWAHVQLVPNSLLKKFRRAAGL